VALPSSAADIVWTNTAGGNWGTAANWSPNQVPGCAGTPWIQNDSNHAATTVQNQSRQPCLQA